MPESAAADEPDNHRPCIIIRLIPMTDRDWDGPLIPMDDLSYRPAPKPPA